MKKIEELFVDEANIKFWKKEGKKHSYLYWVKATLEIEDSFIPEEIFIPKEKIREIDLSLFRGKIYDLLKKGFNNPDLELCTELSNGFINHLLKEIDFIDIEDKVFKLLTEYRGKNKEDILDELRKEYTRLIYDPYMPFIPPYESVYRGEKQVQGKITWKVEEFYKRYNLTIDGVEMADHISHECEFISILSYYQYEELLKENIKKAGEYNKGILEFLNKHLLFWGAKFCLDLLSLTKNSFYLALALLGKRVFDYEYNLIHRGVYETCIQE